MSVAGAELPAEDGGEVLRRCIEADAEMLRATYAVYLQRTQGMAPEDVWEQAHEVLAEVVTIALAKADAFDPARSPRAWLLGIGSKVILRSRAALLKKRHWEMAPLPGDADEYLPPGVLFDRLAVLAPAALDTTLEEAEAVTTLLSRVAPAYRDILRLAIITGLSGDRLAQALHCTPGAARVRLHRALEQLRAAWNRPTNSPTEGSSL